VDCILAPIYLRFLFGLGIDGPDLELFVDRTLASALLLSNIRGTGKLLRTNETET